MSLGGPRPFPPLLTRPLLTAPQYLPTLYVATALTLTAVLQAWTAAALLVTAPYCTWVYLRFFQWQPETTLRGDPSEDFRFSSFFPDAVQVGGRQGRAQLGSLEPASWRSQARTALPARPWSTPP